MSNKTIVAKHMIIIIVVSYLLLMLGNGAISLTNPDEVFYVQTAKEMAQQKTWMTPYLFGAPQFEKPVLTYWLLRVALIVFGDSPFGARFFPAIFALLGVIATYFFGLFAFKNENKALMASLVLASCGFYIGLARTVFTDMIVSVLILFALTSFYWGYSQEKRKNSAMVLFFAFSGLAVLTKGPLGILIPLGTVFVFLAVRRQMRFLRCRGFWLGLIVFLLIAAPWYLLMVKRYGDSFTREFFYNDHIRRIIEAEHSSNDTWYFYPLSTIASFFPWSLFALASLGLLVKNCKDKAQPVYAFLVCWIAVVFMLFQFAHSKLVSYIFPLFPALALATGGFIYDALSKKSRSVVYLSVATAAIFLTVPIAVSIAVTKYPEYVSSWIPLGSFIAVNVIVALAVLIFAAQRKVLAGIGILVFSNFLLIAHIPLFRADIEPYVSSKAVAEFLLKNHQGDSAILCSKSFVRGVHYYTNKDVAVLDTSGTQFFSPHPVPFLSGDSEVHQFLSRQSPTFCVLKKSAVEDIKRIADQKFKVTALSRVGYQYILRIDPI